MDTEEQTPRQTGPWWGDARRRTRVVVITFLALALAGILFPAFTNYLFAGDQRVLVVTMKQDAGQAARQALKDACGDLPGVSAVLDQGNPDPGIQGRFPVRFDIGDTTAAQEAALQQCINDNEELGVVGFLPERG